jgi:hypothetical protein
MQDSFRTIYGWLFASKKRKNILGQAFISLRGDRSARLVAGLFGLKHKSRNAPPNSVGEHHFSSSLFVNVFLNFQNEKKNFIKSPTRSGAVLLDTRQSSSLFAGLSISFVFFLMKIFRCVDLFSRALSCNSLSDAKLVHWLGLLPKRACLDDDDNHDCENVCIGAE